MLLLPLWLVVMGLVRLWQQLKGWVMARRRGAVDEALQRERLHHTALLDAGRRRFELLCRAIDDPSLAEAVSTHNDVPQPKRRQFLYIQAMYESLLLEHATGALPWDQLIARLRIFGRNEVVAEYWERTREERRAWPADSLEARVGQALDLIMDELGEDPDEWWVAGSDLTEDASS
ncbi:DUF6082 family protein [Streptomyces nigra]|uniref:DUF6082 family protein n=1 Tax=Streptomyces nigra TaxID=1827580 RepID=UPI0037D0BCA7